MLKQAIMGNKFLFNLALSVKDYHFKRHDVTLSEVEMAYLAELKQNGVLVIPNFFSPDECNSMIDAFENLDEKYANHYGNDKRIFGMEKLSKPHKNLFYDNKMLARIGSAYLNDELVLQTTMAAKITADKTAKVGSGGGWHRDSFSKQFKAIAYLENVEPHNGPFMYIKGSHKLENIKKILAGLGQHQPISSPRYTLDEIDQIQQILGEEITYYTATAGTLILADIRGIHTGMPIEQGRRYSIFNYYIAKSDHQENNEIERLGMHE